MNAHLDKLSLENCSNWPACGCCFDCDDLTPRSRWAAPIIIALSLAAWAGIFAVIALVLSLTSAEAHQAPTGWQFDPECCGNGDCIPVPMTTIRETPDGYQIEHTGEIIPFQSRKVRPSPDGMPYRCSVGGKPDGNTYCIYVPKGGV